MSVAQSSAPLLVLLNYLAAFNTTRYGFLSNHEDWELGALCNSFLSGQFQLINGGEDIYPSTMLMWGAASFSLSLSPAVQHLHVALGPEYQSAGSLDPLSGGCKDLYGKKQTEIKS